MQSSVLMYAHIIWRLIIPTPRIKFTSLFFNLYKQNNYKAPSCFTSSSRNKYSTSPLVLEITHVTIFHVTTSRKHTKSLWIYVIVYIAIYVTRYVFYVCVHVPMLYIYACVYTIVILFSCVCTCTYACMFWYFRIV